MYRRWIERKECHDGTLWRRYRCREGDVGRRVVDEPDGALADHQRRGGLGRARRARAPLQPTVIVLEATGGYETGAASALTAAGLPGRDRQSAAGARFRQGARPAGKNRRASMRASSPPLPRASSPRPARCPMTCRPICTRSSPAAAARRDADGRAQSGPAGPRRRPQEPAGRISPGSRSSWATPIAICGRGLRPVRSGACAISGCNRSPASGRRPRPVCWRPCQSSAR